ncbi:MAG: hypothetical protein ACR2PI_11880 [Hyphomicrobiaceae bacterium]
MAADDAQQAADRWLEDNFDAIGRKSTMLTAPYLEFATPAEAIVEGRARVAADR